jgi:O-antigen ligase
MWATGFEHWTTSPIVGYGWGTFRHLAGSSSHNTYLDIMVNLGLIGLILYLSVFVRVISHLGRAARLLKTSTALIARATIAGIIGMATSVFFVNLYKPWLVVWAFIGLVVGLTARDFALERATVKRKVHARMHAHR